MKLYYKAVTREGKFVQGFIEAKDISEAAAYLRTKEFIPIRIFRKEKNRLSELLPFFSNKVKGKDVVLFTRQLSSMISSGLTLLRSLQLLKEQVSNTAMIEVIDSIINDVEEGVSFAAAIAKYDEVFSPIYIALIKASESSGVLDKALFRLADNLEKEEKLKSTIKSALMYPAIVVIMMGLVVAIMMIFVIPQFSQLYQSLNTPLPLPTQIVVGFSRLVTVFWPITLGVIIIAVFLFRRWHRTDSGKLIIDSLLLKLPIFGNLIKKTILAEFSRTFGLLIGTGTLVVDSLVQSADTTGNIHYKNAIVDVSKRVEKGVAIGDAMSSYTLFPPLLIQLVKIGEQTGKLDETLGKASEYFGNEVDAIVKNLTTLLEPIIMLALGLGVAFLIISVITPIYSLLSHIQ